MQCSFLSILIGWNIWTINQSDSKTSVAQINAKISLKVRVLVYLSRFSKGQAFESLSLGTLRIEIRLKVDE